MRDAGAWRAPPRGGGSFAERLKRLLLWGCGCWVVQSGIGFCVAVLEKGRNRRYNKTGGMREKLQSVNVRRSEYDKTGVCVRASGFETVATSQYNKEIRFRTECEQRVLL